MGYISSGNGILSCSPVFMYNKINYFQVFAVTLSTAILKAASMGPQMRNGWLISHIFCTHLYIRMFLDNPLCDGLKNIYLETFVPGCTAGSPTACCCCCYRPTGFHYLAQPSIFFPSLGVKKLNSFHDRSPALGTSLMDIHPRNTFYPEAKQSLLSVFATIWLS